MTVTELRQQLAGANPDDTVTLGRGPGVLTLVTVTVNGYVILDSMPPGPGPHPADPRHAPDLPTGPVVVPGV